jgi:hypothetical protein
MVFRGFIDRHYFFTPDVSDSCPSAFVIVRQP